MLVVAAGVFFAWRRMKPQEAEKETTGDLLQVKKIDEGGLILTADERYMMMAEVRPVAMPLKSEREQEILWNSYRDWLNAISHPVRWRSESQNYDMGDYFQDLKAKAIESQDQHQMAYAQELNDYFSTVLEEEYIRDRRYYIMLETDARYLNEQQFQVPLLSQWTGKGEMDEDTARSELMNSMRLTESIFGSAGLAVIPFDRAQVLAYLYRNTYRDASGVLSYQQMNERGLLEDGKQVSLTRWNKEVPREDAEVWNFQQQRKTGA